MVALTGMITGSGRVSLLSGRIQRYRVDSLYGSDSASLHGCALADRWAAAPASWAAQAACVGGGLLGRARNSAQKP
jgi:hypothetical protein